MAQLTVPIVVDWDSIKDRIINGDVVEVVRCKDYKWYKTNYLWNGKEHKVCVIEPYEPVRKECDFCSRGERKETEDGAKN